MKHLLNYTRAVVGVVSVFPLLNLQFSTFAIRINAIATLGVTGPGGCSWSQVEEGGRAALPDGQSRERVTLRYEFSFFFGCLDSLERLSDFFYFSAGLALDHVVFCSIIVPSGTWRECWCLGKCLINHSRWWVDRVSIVRQVGVLAPPHLDRGISAQVQGSWFDWSYFNFIEIIRVGRQAA